MTIKGQVDNPEFVPTAQSVMRSAQRPPTSEDSPKLATFVTNLTQTEQARSVPGYLF